MKRNVIIPSLAKVPNFRQAGKPELVLLLSMVLLLAFAGGALRLVQDTVLAQTSANYDLSWYVLSGGGREVMTSGSHTVHGTLGQLAIGPATSGQTSVRSGYWSGVQQGAGGYPIYLPIVLKAHR